MKALPYNTLNDILPSMLREFVISLEGKVSKIFKIKNRLRLYRKNRGMTQGEVAYIIGHPSPAQVSRWERGERIPSLMYALRLSALYQRLVNDLFFDFFDEERGHVFTRLRELEKRKEQKCV